MELLDGFDDYELLEEIGRGGQGVVYRAWQKSLNRAVALKIIGLGPGTTKAHLKRFRLEAEAAARLNHPFIVPVHEIRQRDGYCYFSMGLVEGAPLDQIVKSKPMPAHRAAKLIVKLARTVQYTHEHGIVHRDIKPANILLDTSGEPHLTDFGVARLLETENDATRTNEILGTPGYMAPEQANGQPDRISPATDVYGLGAVLYYLLTGHPPFAGTTPYQTVRLLLETEPRDPRLCNPKLDRELATICLKCLEKDPEHRYPSALALAQDLERWLKHEPIQARHVSLARRGWKWARRNPAAAGLIASLVALATAIGVIMWKINLFGSPPTSSIAVLPFENLSNDREDASFADGLQDDLLTKLASIADLKVISRTSVMRYRGSWDTHQIGKLLGVSFVLEGSVRKTGAWVHINAQLIDAQTDAHVWAKQYDGDLKDLFAIQTEIAKDVAEQLRVKISHAEKEAIERPPTTDLTAFDLYSRAKSLLLMTSFGNRDKGNLLQAADLLSEAIAHDPSYFQAYCELAYAHDLLYLFGNDHTPRRLALAEAAIRSAYRLRPDAAEVHLARAENLYRGHLDYDRALSELELARKASANDPRLFELKGYIQRRQGKQEEALCNLKRAVDLDPRNVVTLQQMAISYRALRRYAEAILVLNRILNIVPDDLDTKKERAGVEFEWHADIQPLRRLVDSTRATDPSAVPAVADGWLICALAERDAIAAEEALAALGEAPLNDGVVQLHRSFLEGLIARMKNDSVRARAAFMSARAEQEKVVRAQPDYSPPLCVLGLIDAALGNKEEALREGARAMELLPVEKDSVDGVLMIAYSAVIAAWTGNKELACEELARATRIPGGVTYGQLKLLPFWDPLRGDPCFENIVASLAPRAPTQATKLKFPVN